MVAAETMVAGESGAAAPARSLMEAREHKSQTLDLSCMELERFPTGFAELKHLRHLILDENDAAGADADLDLPPKLRTLSAAGTGLREVPQRVAKHPCLERLSLGANHITDITRVLRCPTLLHAGLSYNCVTTLPLLSWSRGAQLGLMSLDLSNNDISDLPAAINALRVISKLQILYLWGNPCSLMQSYRRDVVAGLSNLLVLDDVEIQEGEGEAVMPGEGRGGYGRGGGSQRGSGQEGSASGDKDEGGRSLAKTRTHSTSRIRRVSRSLDAMGDASFRVALPSEYSEEFPRVPVRISVDALELEHDHEPTVDSTDPDVISVSYWCEWECPFAYDETGEDVPEPPEQAAPPETDEAGPHGGAAAGTPPPPAVSAPSFLDADPDARPPLRTEPLKVQLRERPTEAVEPKKAAQDKKGGGAAAPPPAEEREVGKSPGKLRWVGRVPVDVRLRDLMRSGVRLTLWRRYERMTDEERRLQREMEKRELEAKDKAAGKKPPADAEPEEEEPLPERAPELFASEKLAEGRATFPPLLRGLGSDVESVKLKLIPRAKLVDETGVMMGLADPRQPREPMATVEMTMALHGKADVQAEA